MALKTFTVEEANACIPQLEELLAEMSNLRAELVAQAPVLEKALSQAGSNGGSKAASEYLMQLQRFNALHKLITDLGCELKDLSLGLVDFPSYRNGALVYLCWQRGEPRFSEGTAGSWRSAFLKASGSSKPDLSTNAAKVGSRANLVRRGL
jgi:hypothetical protein